MSSSLEKLLLGSGNGMRTLCAWSGVVDGCILNTVITFKNWKCMFWISYLLMHVYECSAQQILCESAWNAVRPMADLNTQVERLLAKFCTQRCVY